MAAGYAANALVGIFAGVELSYWFGFGKNRLALEAEDAYKR